MQHLKQLEHSPKKFGTDMFLTHAEIHLVELIGNNPNSSVSDLSRILGITKGAVSQNLKKMEAKKISYKIADSENTSRSVVYLTDKGKTAYNEHKKWHEKMDGGFVNYLNELSDNENEIINSFMSRVDDFLKRRIESEE